MNKRLRKGMHKKYPWWDYCYMLEMVEDWLKHSSKMHNKHGCLVRSDRTAKEMKIAYSLISRIREDEYSKPNKVFPCRNRHVKENILNLGLEAFDYNPEAEDLRKQDVEYLFNFMKKHILNWWD